MAYLIDPDIDMICLYDRASPEPSIRTMVLVYYSEVFEYAEAKMLADKYIQKLDEACRSTK